MQSMNAKDAVSASLAECFVTIEGNRYNFMQAINLEASIEKTKSEIPILGRTGKGNKTRRVPIMKNTAVLVEAYISENRLGLAHKANYPLFTNKQYNKLTKEGVAYIINKYAVMAHEVSDKVPEKVRSNL